jgi:hypothetical protein
MDPPTFLTILYDCIVKYVHLQIILHVTFHRRGWQRRMLSWLTDTHKSDFTDPLFKLSRNEYEIGQYNTT